MLLWCTIYTDAVARWIQSVLLRMNNNNYILILNNDDDPAKPLLPAAVSLYHVAVIRRRPVSDEIKSGLCTTNRPRRAQGMPCAPDW